MNLFILGAGKPAHGDKPAVLKHISTLTTVLDWNIHSFKSFVNIKDIHFLGGYHIDDVVESYPELNFSIIPDWKKNNILHTFFSAPFLTSDALVSYSDTIFRQNIVHELLDIKADVVFCVDSLWEERFESRSLEDIKKAETILLDGLKAEFTGLIYFSKKAIAKISQLDVTQVGTNLLDLISFLKQGELTVKPFDIKGEWAELNSPDDIAKFILGTKADTLARLEPIVNKSHIGKQVTFTSLNWERNPALILDNIIKTFVDDNLVVRSSSKGEDNWEASNAGGFESVLNVDISNTKEITAAVKSVIDSYKVSKHGDNQILVQAFLNSVSFSGVIFTCGLESGAPYYRINFDDINQSTESVTAGTHGDLRTVIISRLEIQGLFKLEPKLIPVIDAVQEIELLLGFDKLDIEFAVDNNGQVHIFQVRPITVNHDKYDIDIKAISNSILNAKNCFLKQQKPSPFLLGKCTILANMPDWNPAEIIGTRPKPLAFSLYRQIITNDIWAQQRAEFGYCDIRPQPLIVSLSGQPYIDTRASFNSFIPNDLSQHLKSKIANAYIKILSENPQLHDKIEFDIAYTIWVPGFLSSASNRLIPYGLTKEDILALEVALKNLTKKSLYRLNADTNSILSLETRRQAVLKCDLSSLDKAFILLDDCKKYGTLAFSHAARAGFVATTFLNSLVENNCFSKKRKNAFLMSFKTVAGNFEEDKYLFSTGKITLEQLKHKYGHLRPGTYELEKKAYWENPEQYLIPDNPLKPKELVHFTLSKNEQKGIDGIVLELGLSLSAESFMEYIKQAIQAREFVKFEFTKNLSKALDLIIETGVEFGIKRKKLSYLEYSDLEQLKLNILSIKNIKKNIKCRKNSFLISHSVELPSLIQNIEDFYCFERHASEPNFVTIKKVEANIYKFDAKNEEDMRGKIIMIPQADPGYDWLFSHGISGLITQYGGANSHMAIRAAEIGLPSAIGVGDKLYEKITLMKKIELNCSNRTIRAID